MDVISNIWNDNLLYILFFSYQFCFKRNFLEFCPQPSVSAVSLSNESTITQCTIWFITKIRAHFSPNGASLVAQRLKHLPAVQETRVRSLSREDPLEKEMAIHSSILAWRIPWSEEPGRLQSMGSQSRTQLRDFSFTSLSPQIGIYCFILSLSI